MTLNEINVGQTVLLDDFSQSQPVYFKLISLGLLPGDPIIVMGKAPFGGPISIKHGSETFFALRRSEALQIHVKNYASKI
ncbi:MAG: ferrous iron transport protein A [Bdellovibrionales bacterium CG11_big_fil_rev_8_21_14_0_20_38_13]|nr:MAG: ferrous iron transport protein A [Bdellovibrionales bacterium CG22_combo_CG10-13_8_21_14_all_38_13]PIR28799.1 MAG: ferrous iron transport protein A [Bdellovibrionales bacterium CG11_big_fil_rev_8_21_14_0_20_38_13]